MAMGVGAFAGSMGGIHKRFLYPRGHAIPNHPGKFGSDDLALFHPRNWNLHHGLSTASLLHGLAVTAYGRGCQLNRNARREEPLVSS
jgi:hypothetical protein